MLIVLDKKEELVVQVERAYVPRLVGKGGPSDQGYLGCSDMRHLQTFYPREGTVTQGSGFVGG